MPREIPTSIVIVVHLFTFQSLVIDVYETYFAAQQCCRVSIALEMIRIGNPEIV